jgi:hypothetical protein
MPKICNGCKSHSDEWILSKELAKRNHRLRIVLAIVVTLWLVTIAGWVVTLGLDDSKDVSGEVSESLFLESDEAVHETEVS